MQNKSLVALATVVDTWGSAPRKIGSKMAINDDAEFVGSVSGGCVESAVIEAALETIQSHRSQLLSFGVSDETAWDVGLACGGSIDVFIQPLEPAIFDTWQQLLQKDDLFGITTIISQQEKLQGQIFFVDNNGAFVGSTNESLAGIILGGVKNVLATGHSQRISVGSPSTAVKMIDLFVEISRPAPTLIIIGGVHIAVALSTTAKSLGYRTIVVDPRRAFSSERRFPNVDLLLHDWPDDAFLQLKITSNTAVVSLTHDPKIDDPALKKALTSPAFYIGALGSKKTHKGRRDRLAMMGISDEQFSRIHGPIGLDIGAQTPEEIAISIMAEIIAAANKPL